jgi:DNA recombination protein RmuC
MIEPLIIANLAAALLGLLLVILVWNKVRQPPGEWLDRTLREELRQSREETSRQARELREEVSSTHKNANDTLVRTLNLLGDDQKALLSQLTKATQEAGVVARDEIQKLVQQTNEGLRGIEKANEDRFDQVRRTLDEKLRQMMDEQKRQLAEVVAALKGLEQAHGEEQKKALAALDQKFQQLQQSNDKKLEEMRQTVDEKLHTTLEKRLGESFKLVSERLEAVQRGLGEMQHLATGVGDLKRVLTNVKERGTWGEYQLGAILEQILTPDQFARNVRVHEGRETVEFAVKLPGREEDPSRPVWLPIDAKFPKEDYERLVAASAAADAEGVRQAAEDLLKQVQVMARDIHDKYIAPPDTTDFGILFLPTEGLYAEVLRQPGYHDELQRKYRVMVAGPATLAAMLNSLRVGFQTLAIEKRAHEVWRVLSAVKTEFGKFGEMLDRVKRQLQTATRTLDETGVRTRAVERKLRGVERLPAGQAASVLELPEAVSPGELAEAREGENDLL